MMNGKLVCSVKKLLNKNIIVLRTMVAGIINTLGTNLSNSYPVIGDIKPFNKLPGSKTSPAVAAVNNNGPCIYSGKISSELNMIIIINKNINTQIVNNAKRNTHKYIKGSSTFR